MGNLMTLYLIDVFGSVLDELAQATSTAADLTALLEQYEKEESDNFKEFLLHELPIGHINRFFAGSNNTDDETTAHLVELITNEPNFCRTARLPAEARFKGLVTETNQTGLMEYDHGISLTEAQFGDNVNSSDFMRLVWDEAERYECEADLWLDFKDSFYVGYRELPKKLIIPNDSEIREYDPTNAYRNHLSGVIAYCLKICDWGACPNGALTNDAIKDGTVEMYVNGQKVSGKMIRIATDCNFLLPESGGLKFKANSDGKFEVSVKVLKEKAFIQFSSFVVW
jgi:hypothetical protein